MVNRTVLVHGLPYFGKLFVELMNGEGWDFRFYPDSGIGNLTGMLMSLVTCDVAYQIGGRVTLGKFLRVAKLLGKNKIVIHWVGTDTTDERHAVASGEVDEWVRLRLTHWAETPWLRHEVNQLGASCDVVPLPGACLPERPSPLPKDFSVLVYVPDTSLGALYGLDSILRVAQQLPQIQFEMVGLAKGSINEPPSNLRIHGHARNLNEFYERSTVVWRPVKHDGLSFMVLESLARGRHVIWSYAFPGCIHAESNEAARDQIVGLHQMHLDGGLHLNEAGLQVVGENYLPHNLKKQILMRLEDLLES
jgi:hypothetical protein